MEDKAILDWILACRSEADEAKRERMNRNKDNYDMFHLRHDFSHKQKGQSTEVLSKQQMAVDTIRSFFQQALVEIGDWWSAEACYPQAEEAMLVKPHEITKLTNSQLEKANYFSHVGSSIQTALLASLAISKTYGCMKPKPRFVSKKKGRGKQLKRWIEKVEDKTWEMKFDVVRAENFFPDPTGKGLYQIEDMWVDLHEVDALSKGENAIYDSAVVAKLPRGAASETEDEFDKSRESGQSTSSSGHRPKVKLTEYWGNILDKQGNIVFENIVCTVANDTVLLRPPEPNPLWHQESPYSTAPLMEVANSVWHRALMDAPTQHNRALNEMYNLLVDAGMMEVHGLKQLRKSALDNPAQVADGIPAGTTLVVNEMLPVGGQVIESLSPVKIPSEAFNIFNIMSQEFNASALTNDLRQGVMPFRAVKATEVVEASQTITSVFQGIAKNYESRQSTRELQLAWMTTAQNWDSISKEEFVALFGEQRGEELSQLAPEDVFASTVNGIKFRVYGISLTLSKAQDYRKLQMLLQTVFSNPMLAEFFLKKYDPELLLGEIMTSLDIDKHKLEIPQAQQMTMQAQPEQGAEAAPDYNSQVPQATSGSLQDMMGGGASFPQDSFPTGEQ
jgi:hypothetical protein